MSKVKEGENDQQYVTNVCKIIHFEGQPTDVVRLGRKKDGHSRPLRVTFSSPFDARVFRARFVEHRKADENADDTKGVHVRASRNESEREKYRKNKDIVRKLNDDAKQADLSNISFSLRDNLAIGSHINVDFSDEIKILDNTRILRSSNNGLLLFEHNGTACALPLTLTYRGDRANIWPLISECIDILSNYKQLIRFENRPGFGISLVVIHEANIYDKDVCVVKINTLSK
ncbi:hypothetical protein CAPTEDRAFT_206309 [Capitella teleta]|uniref:Uncharacterized protein n=1 Tax=Capitella teleta TaxID=283909 RepID=R7TF70_CAPTE|nr:hypothetical protein CAPTEDRAFT_206309 [Capitella teleta]|eukprot:ELT92403.1 hypothetical protein CAPTEDRAFT_206309 [Capitella teleta]